MGRQGGKDEDADCSSLDRISLRLYNGTQTVRCPDRKQHDSASWRDQMIKYKRGYKYQLFEDYSIQTPFRPDTLLIVDFVSLDSSGLLTIYKGYAWDGPSGPTIDTKSFMRGSLVHDVLYQLMYNELLPYSVKGEVDDFLIVICDEDGMWQVRQAWVRKGVEIGGDPRPSRIKQILIAP